LQFTETCRFCQRFNSSIVRVALGLALVFVACGIYWAMLLEMHAAQRADAEQQARLRAAQMAKALSVQVGTLLSGLDYALQNLVAEHEARNAEGFDLAVRTALRAFPEGAILQVAVADSQGTLIYSSLHEPGAPPPSASSIADREHFKYHAEARARPANLFISKPVRGRVSQRWSIQLSRPLAAQGVFAGVVVLSLSPAYISSFFHELFEQPGDVVMLLRDDGSYLARSRQEAEVMGKAVPQEREFLIDPRKRVGAYDATAAIDGFARYYAWSRAADYPVVVSLGLEKAAVFTQLERTIRSSLLRNALGGIVILFGALVIAGLFLQKKRSQALLAEGEQRLKKLASHVPGALFQFRRHADGRTEFPYVSPGIYGLHHVTTDAMADGTKRLLETLHPDDVESVKDGIRQSAASLTLWESKYRLRLKDGSERWLRGRANPEREPGGSTLWNGYLNDITDEHLAQAALQAAEERLRVTFDALQDGLWEWNIVDDVVRWDERCYVMLGYRPDEFTLDIARISELIHPLDRERHEAKVRQQLAGSTPYRAEFRMRTASGGWLWIEARGEVVASVDGRPARMMGTHSDISLRVSQARLRRALLDQSAAAIFLASPDRRISYANARAHEGFAAQGQALVGCSFQQIHLGEESFHNFAEHYHALRASGSVRFEYALRDSRQQARWFEVHGTLLDADDPNGGVIWTMVDIDDRHRAEAALAIAQRRLMAVIERFPGGVLVEERVAREVVVINQALCQLLGLTQAPDALIGRPHDDLGKVLPEGLLECLIPGEAPAAGEAAAHAPQFGVEQSLPDGRVFEIDRVPLLDDDEHLGIFWLVRDITERKQRESTLKQLAATDTLTGLPNRRAFMAHLAAELAQIRQGAVESGVIIMLDLDFFKKVNDTYGHGVGDEVLRHMAALLQSKLRRGDMAGRLGGEEFAVMLSSIGLSDGLMLADRLRETLVANPAQTEAGTVRFTASLGVSVLNQSAGSPEACLDQADQALYQAKREGRNRVIAWNAALPERIAP